MYKSTPELGTPSLQDSQLGPDGVLYREVPLYFPTDDLLPHQPMLPLETLPITTLSTFKQEANEQYCRFGKDGVFTVLLSYLLLDSTNTAMYEPLRIRILPSAVVVLPLLGRLLRQGQRALLLEHCL